MPAPRYALRRARILTLTETLARGRLLEVGCGAGALLLDLGRQGFSCTALEPSPGARALAGHVLGGGPAAEVFAQPQAVWTEAFDLLLACEVLEHLEDDLGALRQWRRWLRPGGRLLLSVPARAERWTATDDWAGHLRRYERDEIQSLLARAGFAVEHFECYGFPLSNLTESLRGRVHARLLRRAARSGSPPSAGSAGGAGAAGTERSGTDRGFETRLYPLQTSWLGVKLFQACCRLQVRFLDRDLGTGYLALARRVEAP